MAGHHLALLLAAGYVYQRQTTAADFEQFPAPGQRVDVGGYSLHIHCMGEGSPTVIVDAGNGDFSLGWSGVQPEVAKFARICTYDRAGYGWSDPSPKSIGEGRGKSSFVEHRPPLSCIGRGGRG